VSDEDYPLVSQYRWRYSYNAKDSTGYAATSYKDEDGQRIYLKMHRLILDSPKGIEVDHRNGDGLDNQRENIWNCTHEENVRNRRYIDKTKDYRHWMTA